MIHLIATSPRIAIGIRQMCRMSRDRYCPATAGGRYKTVCTNFSPRLGCRMQSTSTPPPRRQQSTAFVSDSTTPQKRAKPNQITSLFQRFRASLYAVLLKPRTIPVPRWVSPQHHTITLSECFGHASFVLVAASYAVDDFLYLRIIAVAGSTAILFFTYFHPHGRVLWLPFQWNVLFIAINSYRIGKVYADRFFAHRLSNDLIRVRKDHFYVLDPIDFAKLVRSGREITYSPGDLVVGQGTPNRYIRLVVKGGLIAVRDGMSTYELEEGSFVSEAGLHAGLMLRGKVESCCGIVVGREPTTVIAWERTELMNLLLHEKMLRRSLKAALSWDIVRKLKGQREMLALGMIENPALWTKKRNEQNHHRYASILQNMLRHPQYLADRKKELNKYRMIHHIDDEHHQIALQRCGWTLAEFEAGFKEGEEVDDEEDGLAGWKQSTYSLFTRMFG